MEKTIEELTIEELREAVKVAQEHLWAVDRMKHEAGSVLRDSLLQLAKAACPFAIGEEVSLVPKASRGMSRGVIERIGQGYGDEDYSLVVRPTKKDGNPAKFTVTIINTSRGEEMNGKGQPKAES